MTTTRRTRTTTKVASGAAGLGLAAVAVLGTLVVSAAQAAA